MNIKAIGSKASIGWCPGIFSIQVVHSSYDESVSRIEKKVRLLHTCDSWASYESNVSFALEKTDLDSARESRRRPDDVKWCVYWNGLVACWRSNAVEVLCKSRWSKSQDGGRNE